MSQELKDREQGGQLSYVGITVIILLITMPFVFFPPMLVLSHLGFAALGYFVARVAQQGQK